MMKVMIKKQSWLLVLLLVGGLGAFVTSPAMAQDKISDPKTVKEGIKTLKDKVATEDSGLSREEEVTPILLQILNWLLGLVGMIALIVLIIGGVYYITALGQEDKIKTAKRIILFAIIGLIVVGMSWSILSFVLSTFRSAP